MSEQKVSDVAEGVKNFTGKKNLSDEEKAQVEAFSELFKLNAQIASVPKNFLMGTEMGQAVTRLQDILFVAAANMKNSEDIKADDMRENFIKQRILIIKSRLCLSNGFVVQNITWKNAKITQMLVDKLVSMGFTVDYVSTLYDSDDEPESSNITTLDDANSLRISF